MIERIGFIGTGAITEAIVTGLAAGPCGLREIWVSPRNQETAARLSSRPALVHVGRDNQDVADRCDLLCLAVRPQVAQQLLSQLHLTSTATADLESQGVFRAQASALDRILARIRKQSGIPARL